MAHKNGKSKNVTVTDADNSAHAPISHSSRNLDEPGTQDVVSFLHNPQYMPSAQLINEKPRANCTRTCR
jgi:hypothetical protein